MMKPAVTAQPCPTQEVLPLRTRYREEMNCQIVHDSIHQREGWMLCYALEVDGAAAGFGSVAMGGPWKDKPAVTEFYLLPEYRARAFAITWRSASRFAAGFGVLSGAGAKARLLRTGRRPLCALQPG